LTNYLLGLELALIVKELELFLLFCNSHDPGDTGLDVIYDIGLSKNRVVCEDLLEKKLVDRLCFLGV
jgi:hypothetical protein